MRRQHWRMVKRWHMRAACVTSCWSTKLGRTTSSWSYSQWSRPVGSLAARSSLNCWKRFLLPWRNCIPRARGTHTHRSLYSHTNTSFSCLNPVLHSVCASLQCVQWPGGLCLPVGDRQRQWMCQSGFYSTNKLCSRYLKNMHILPLALWSLNVAVEVMHLPS